MKKETLTERTREAAKQSSAPATRRRLRSKRTSQHKPSKCTHFREYKSVLYNEPKIPKSFKLFFKSRILPLIELDGYKLAQKQKIVLYCIHNLAIAKLRNKSVADNRNNSTNSLRIAIWDVIVKARLCRVCIGDELTGYVSRYRATGKLVKLLRLFEEGSYIDLRLDCNTKRKRPTKDAYLFLHSGTRDITTGKRLPKEQRKQIMSLIDLPSNILRYLKEREDQLRECNRINGEYTWSVKCPKTKRSQLSYEPNYCLKESHSGRIGRYTRHIGWSNISIQQLSKKERKRILIDDESATELDYGQFDIRRHYHFQGIDPTGDAYKPELILPRWYSSGAATKKKKRIVRKFLKRSTNVLLNVSSEPQGIRAIGNVLHKCSKKQKRLLWEIFFDYEDLYENAPTQLAERILRVHADIELVFCNDFFGPLMMSLGAEMMFEIRRKFAKKNKPCYCIHDAILCRKSDRRFARKMMKKIYRKWVPCGFDPADSTHKCN